MGLFFNKNNSKKHIEGVKVGENKDIKQDVYSEIQLKKQKEFMQNGRQLSKEEKEKIMIDVLTNMIKKDK